jgi:hypothetical protein
MRSPLRRSLQPSPSRSPLKENKIRPDAGPLPVPLGFTREQILLGDRVFHGEAADGQCSQCHGWDAK